MLPFAEEGGDPIDAGQMMFDVGGYEMITIITNDTLLSPLKIF
jgi:hypothetical protein